MAGSDNPFYVDKKKTIRNELSKMSLDDLKKQKENPDPRYAGYEDVIDEVIQEKEKEQNPPQEQPPPPPPTFAPVGELPMKDGKDTVPAPATADYDTYTVDQVYKAMMQTTTNATTLLEASWKFQDAADQMTAVGTELQEAAKSLFGADGAWEGEASEVFDRVIKGFVALASDTGRVGTKYVLPAQYSFEAMSKHQVWLFGEIQKITNKYMAQWDALSPEAKTVDNRTLIETNFQKEAETAARTAIKRVAGYYAQYGQDFAIKLPAAADYEEPDPPEDEEEEEEEEEDPAADEPPGGPEDDPGADDPGLDDPGADDPGLDDPGLDDPNLNNLTTEDPPGLDEDRTPDPPVVPPPLNSSPIGGPDLNNDGVRDDLDTNQDGIPDVPVDSNNDGIPDGLDTDGDGRIDAPLPPDFRDPNDPNLTPGLNQPGDPRFGGPVPVGGNIPPGGRPEFNLPKSVRPPDLNGPGPGSTTPKFGPDTLNGPKPIGPDGLGPGGLGSKLGGPGIRPGGLGGGLGAGAGGMPYPPGGGAGGPMGGDQNQERERTTWLMEDEDVWNDDCDLSPAVLGRPDDEE